MMRQNRFKSPVLWQSLVSAILMFLLNSGIIGTELHQLAIEALNIVFSLGIFTGLLNNPSDAEKF